MVGLSVGRQHYTAPGFMREAAERGISKRIGALPRDFKVGESWVYLAHLDAVGPWLPQYPEREAWLASAARSTERAQPQGLPAVGDHARGSGAIVSATTSSRAAQCSRPARVMQMNRCPSM